jgi:hypothetical protein
MAPPAAAKAAKPSKYFAEAESASGKSSGKNVSQDGAARPSWRLMSSDRRPTPSTWTTRRTTFQWHMPSVRRPSRAAARPRLYRSARYVVMLSAAEPLSDALLSSTGGERLGIVRL